MFAAIFTRIILSVDYHTKKNNKIEEVNAWFAEKQIKVSIEQDTIYTNIMGNELKKFLKHRTELFHIINIKDPKFIQMWNVSQFILYN
jgi:arsenate reductase-like glutaredoxin family protein